MNLDEYRDMSLQTWDQMAPGWEDRRDWLNDMMGFANEWLVDHADPQPGQTVLDIAAGTGDLGFIAAERVGDGGKVVTTDFSPEMLAAARRNGEQRGLSNVEYRVLDAERMDLDDDSFDVVLCRFGYMLMADPAAALAETRRVLRDGGTLAFAVWQTAERNPWAALPGMTLVQRGHMPPPEPGAPGIFAMGEADRVKELVTGAGFDEPRLEELTLEWRMGSEDLWDMVTRLAGPLARVINGLPDEEQRKTRAAIEESLEQFRQNGQLVVPARSGAASRADAGAVPEAMRQRRLGELQVSVVGLGCSKFGSYVDAAATRAVVNAALDAGISFFDTADVYGGEGRSERVLGEATRARRDDVVLATKWGMAWTGDGEPPGPSGSRAYVRRSAELSLSRLGTDRIDLYQYHLPDGVTPIEETLGALDELVREGKVRAIGCSNFTGAQLAEAADVARANGFASFVSVQNEYSLLERSIEAEVIPQCRRLGSASSPTSRWPAGC